MSGDEARIRTAAGQRARYFDGDQRHEEGDDRQTQSPLQFGAFLRRRRRHQSGGRRGAALVLNVGNRSSDGGVVDEPFEFGRVVGARAFADRIADAVLQFDALPAGFRRRRRCDRIRNGSRVRSRHPSLHEDAVHQVAGAVDRRGGQHHGCRRTSRNDRAASRWSSADRIPHRADSSPRTPTVAHTAIDRRRTRRSIERDQPHRIAMRPGSTPAP